MKISATMVICILQLFATGAVWAQADMPALQDCVEMQGHSTAEQALACFNRVAQQQKEASPALFKAKHDNSLAAEWTPSDELISVYKQNYFLVYSHSSHPNNTPGSPNPQSQVPYTYSLDNKEMKFQLSIKGHMLGENRHTLWFGYTQLSFWQIYDSAHSTPFRESDYEPELIYSYRPADKVVWPGLRSSFVNTALVHQSNGQTQPRSRGWNRLYIQVGLERELGDGDRIALIPRLWRRIGAGAAADDDNPDILTYYGRGDLEARYYHGQDVYLSIARIHSLQFDYATPMPKLFGVQIRNTNFHVQLFDGYGESLIDYNQRHATIGFGISMPFE